MRSEELVKIKSNICPARWVGSLFILLRLSVDRSARSEAASRLAGLSLCTLKSPRSTKVLAEITCGESAVVSK